MPDRPVLPRSLIRRAANVELSLGSLEAISEIRAHLDRLEKLATASAREKGATVEDIAEALRLTPQAIYYRQRHGRMNVQTTPGQPNVPPAAGPAESAVATHDRGSVDDDPALAPVVNLPD